MNMFEMGERLKDFSKDQLVNEMRRPTGSVPQFLVLSELQRRRRVEQAAQADQQPQQTTVADDAIAAAGVPQAGLMQMARALAPKTDMDQNTGAEPVQAMSGGGTVRRMQPGGLAGMSRDLDVYSPTLGAGMTGDEMRAAQALIDMGMDPDVVMDRIAGVQTEAATEVDPEMERIQQENIDFLTGMGQGARRIFIDPLIQAGQVVGEGASAVAEGINTGLTNLAAIVGDEAAYEDLSNMGEYISEQRSGPRWEPPEYEVTLGDTLEFLLGGRRRNMTMGDPDALVGEEDLLPPAAEETPDAATPDAADGADGAGGTGAGGGLDSDRMLEQDKWLALAQFGLGLMSSREPTLGGAIGEAGQTALGQLREARQQAVERDLANRTLAARSASQPAGLTPAQALTAINNRIEALSMQMVGPIEPGPRLQIAEQIEALQSQADAIMAAMGYGMGPATTQAAAVNMAE